MIYRYVEHADGVFRPIVPVTMKGPASSLHLDMLIDSGADVSVIARYAAEIMGIDLSSSQQEVFELADGSRVAATLAEIEVSIADQSVRLPFAILDTASEAITPLLGQRGFFDQFEIRFRRFREEFEVLPAEG